MEILGRGEGKGKSGRWRLWMGARHLNEGKTGRWGGLTIREDDRGVGRCGYYRSLERGGVGMRE